MTPRLCGGTFLTLLSAVKNPNSQKRLFFAKRQYTASNKGLLVALLRMMNPDHEVQNPETINVMISQFKNCARSYGAEIPLNDSRYINAYHERITMRDPALYAEMKDYMQSFLQVTEPAQMNWLGNALMELIQKDASTQRSECWMDTDGRFVNREKLLDAGVISLPLLLAAIWDYIAVYVDDNEIGAETIQCWISGKMTPNDRGVLSKDIGASAAGKYRFSLDVPHDSAIDHQTASSNPCPEPVANTKNTSESVQRPLQSDPIIQNIYGGMVFSPGTQIQNVHYFAQPHGGTSVFEMQGLRSDYYSLFVLDGETLTDDHFSMSKRCVFSAGTGEEDQKWLRMMGDDVTQMLLSTPAVFTLKQKGKEASPEQVSILGRVTNIRVQKNDLRISWKLYRPFPMTVLFDHCSDLGIYYSNMSTEMDEEHWAVKPEPLLRKLAGYGVNPFVSA